MKKDLSPKVEVHIESANLNDNSKVVDITVSDDVVHLDTVRLSYLRHLTHDSARVNIPLSLPDIKIGDPSKSSGSLGLEAIYIDLETTTDVTLTRSELFLDPSESGLTENIQNVLHTKIAPDYLDTNKKLFITFSQYLTTHLRKEASASKIFEDTHQNLYVHRLQIDEVARFMPNIVILGPPGSGKSTFINYLVLRMASAQQVEASENIEASWAEEYLPIPANLPSYIDEIVKTKEDLSLIEYLSTQYKNTNLDAIAVKKVFLQAIASGKALLLLDGLDEVPPKYRVYMKNQIEQFSNSFNCRIIVACRTLSYEYEKWKISPQKFGVVSLAPFDDHKIDNFLVRFYGEISTKGYLTSRPISDLKKNIREAVKRKDLRRLATNPLLLTIMSLVHISRGELPSSRAVLYEEAVEWLLSRWAEKSRRRDKTIRQMLEDEDVGSSFSELEEVLRKIAFEVHSNTSNDIDATAKIPDSLLVSYLRRLHPAYKLGISKIWATELVEAIKEQAGLLIPSEVKENEELYTFPHRTFQEYLVARHLLSQENFSDIINLHGRLGPLWREIVLLAVGYKAQKDGVDAPITAAGKLCPKNMPESDEDWQAAILAGEIFLEINLSRVYKNGRDDELKRTQYRLADLLEKGVLSVLERAHVGDVLSSLGDVRPGVELSNGDPDISWIEIPEGSFIVTQSEEELLDETNTSSYSISKYPITNAQYAAFVAARKIATPLHWESSAPPRHLRTHPVVWVSWFNALEFCDWLSQKLGFEVRLPTSIEWTKAARGLKDSRPWPWGNFPDISSANLGLTGIRGTSAVGIFPLGTSDPWIDINGGPLDMSGNVYEWCYDVYSNLTSNRDDVQTPRKIRGGSFKLGLDAAKCVPRNVWRLPRNAHSDLGFRIVKA